MGNITRTIPAQTGPINTPLGVTKAEMATGRVRECFPVSISAKRNSFQLKTKLKSPAESKPGKERGTVILRKALTREHPFSAKTLI